VFRVEGAAGVRFVKQALDGETRRCQRREAAMLRFLESTGDGSVPVPRLIDEDPVRAVLVLEGFPRHVPMSAAGFPSAIPSTMWEGLGAALRALHRRSPPPLPAECPWIASLDRPVPSFLRVAGEGRLRLVARIQASPLWRNGLAALRSRWRPTAATHGDLRIDNVLVDPTHDRPDLRLVDWEIGGPGDPAADLGWIVGDLLAAAIEVRENLDSVVPAASALWRAYAGDRARADRERMCEGAALWAAARLLLAAYERLEGPRRLDPSTSRFLECAEDALARPRGFGRAIVGKREA
jgi:aminoglycoside phosphotransferase (APT) family kinase protein